MKCLLFFVVAILCHVWAEDVLDSNKTYDGTYLIVAPKTVRPGLPFAVSVNILKSEDNKPVTVNIRIIDDSNKTVVQAFKDVSTGSPETVKIDKVPNTLVEGIQYRLQVTGQSQSKKPLFDQSRDVTFSSKAISIFVQSDKKIYKPGSVVHFRVICVYPDLKPYKGYASLKVKDPNNNVVQQFTNVTFENGVLGKEDKMKIQLTDEPPLGDWNIIVEVSGQKTEYSFTVDKYVLPKFEVTIKPPPYITVTDDLALTVSAKYTYGKGVSGTATVISEYPYWRSDDKPMRISKAVELDVNGEAVVRFPNKALRENQLITEYGYNSIKLTATVTEALTGIQRNGTGNVMAYKLPYKIQINKAGDSFQPGLDFTVSVAIITQDDKPTPENANQPITVQTYYYFPYVTDVNGTVERSDPVETKEVMSLDSDGSKTITFKTLSNATSLRVEVRYNASRFDNSSNKTALAPEIETATYYNPFELSTSEYVEASKSPTKSYLQLRTKSPSVNAGETAKFTVKSTTDITTITAQVMTRGYMVYIKNIKMSNNEADISIPTTNEMSPTSRLIVYAVRPENREIIVSSMDLKVAGLFRNNVSISVNPKRVEPNQTVNFTIKASPKSYIGLLAVDQSVLLLKSGNDITQQDVESDIAQYDTSGGGYFPWRSRFIERAKRSICWRCGWWGIGGKDAASIFENSGVLVFTDAYLYREPMPPRTYYLRMRGGEMKNGLPGPPEPIAAAGWTGSKSSAEPVVRSKFPESWIWSDVTAGADGQAVYTANVPDTITSWITTAFAMHDEDGLGVAPEPAKLEVFRPFFIRLNLPYSVKRGEKLALQVLIFNYMTEQQTVTVNLEHNDHSGFDFIDKPGVTKDKGSTKVLNTRTVKVPGGSGSASIFFPIIPTKVGDLKLLVKAYAQDSSDAVEKTLIVEAEGFPLYKNKPFVVDLSAKDSWTDSFQLDIPANVVPGSQKASVSFVGDIMGSVLENIDKLIQMPYGCGEQNMLNFVPNIVVTRYLKATSRLTPELEAKTKRYMEAGYQRELTYQRDDFSYSAFGKSDKAGSTWLTAFVVRSFHQAKPYIFVDDEKLKESLKFLKLQQKENGVFSENGEVHHKAMQGGSGEGGPPLTAYVFLAMFENDMKNAEALNYLERSLERVSNDSYALAILSYALQLAGSSKKDDAFKKLEKLAIEKDGSKHWSQSVGGSDSKEASWWDRPRPVDIEMTAYALLTYVLRNDTAGAIPLVRWLVSQQNAFGGYSSTQDTVMALQALGAYAEKAYSPNIAVTTIVKNGDQKYTFNVKADNAIVQQSYELKNLDKPIEINANGKGISFGHVSWHYNLLQLADAQPFICKKDVSQNSANDVLVNLCCKYNLPGKSNMALMEINSPSGFVIDNDHLNELTKLHDLQRVEMEQGDQKANIYFNSLSNENLCLNVSAQRAFFVGEQKPATIKVIDYYNPVHQIQFDYSINKRMEMNEICGGDCWKDAGDKPSAVGVDPSSKGNSTNG